MADPCINTDLNNINNITKNENALTKKQIYSKAVRGRLNAQGRTAYATQNKFGTNSNIYNLQKVENTNILLFTRTNCG
jgi:hypothetical protein